MRKLQNSPWMIKRVKRKNPGSTTWSGSVPKSHRFLPDLHILTSTSWPPHPDLHILTSTSWPPRPDLHILTSTSWPPHPDLHVLTSTSRPPHPDLHILTSTPWPPQPDLHTLNSTSWPPHPDLHTLTSTSWAPHPDLHILTSTPWPPHPDLHILTSTSRPPHPDLHTLTSTPWPPHPDLHTLTSTSWPPHPVSTYKSINFIIGTRCKSDAGFPQEVEQISAGGLWDVKQAAAASCLKTFHLTLLFSLLTHRYVASRCVLAHFHLSLSLCVTSLSSSSSSVTLPATAVCRAALSGHSLLLFPLRRPPSSPSPLLSALSSRPTSLSPLIICCATLALQGRSHWSALPCPPLLICYATAIPSCTSHWSLSAEFSITLLSPSFCLYPPSPPPPRVVWSHSFAVRDLFLCHWGVCHLQRLYQPRTEGLEKPGEQQQQHIRSYFHSGARFSFFSSSVLHQHWRFQSVISFTWTHQRAFTRQSGNIVPLMENWEGICVRKYHTALSLLSHCSLLLDGIEAARQRILNFH